MLISATYYTNTQSDFKTDLIFTALFNVNFYIENHESFGSLTKN